MIRIGKFLVTTLIQTIIAALFVFIWSGPVFAEGVTVSSAVDRNAMGINDTLTYTILINASEEVDLAEPRLPDIGGFELLNKWPSTAVSQKMVTTSGGMQFQTNYRKEFHYQFSPTQVGNLSIGSFEVVVDGKVHKTEPILIKVTQNSPSGATPGTPRARPNAGFEDPFEAMENAEQDLFDQLLKQRQRLLRNAPGQEEEDPLGGLQRPGGNTQLSQVAFRSLPKNPNEAFFVSVEVDKTEVFEGEQITANWYVYTRGRMESLDRLKFPSLKGFWKEIIEEVPTIQFSEEMVDGVPWHKAIIASHALFPIKAGTAVIDEYKIKSRVRTAAQMFNYQGKVYEYTKTSTSVPIKVKPLPVEGRGTDFTGAVGVFEVFSSVDNVNVLANQPFSLKVRFEGSGNAKLIDLPALNLPEGLEQFESKSDSKFFKNGRSFKEFDILVIPRQEGQMVIPPISVTMFDPQTGKYYTKTTDPIHLNVENNPNAPMGSAMRLADQAKKSEAKVNPLVLPQPLLVNESQAGMVVLTNPWVWLGSYVMALLVLLLKARSALGWGVKKRSLKDQLSKRFKKVEEFAAKGDHRNVGIEMTNVFYSAVGEVSGSGGAALEIEKLLELMPPSVRRDHGPQLVKSFEYFQTLGFAPEALLEKLKEKELLKKELQVAKKTILAVAAAVGEEK